MYLKTQKPDCFQDRVSLCSPAGPNSSSSGCWACRHTPTQSLIFRKYLMGKFNTWQTWAPTPTPNPSLWHGCYPLEIRVTHIQPHKIGPSNILSRRGVRKGSWDSTLTKWSPYHSWGYVSGSQFLVNCPLVNPITSHLGPNKTHLFTKLNLSGIFSLVCPWCPICRRSRWFTSSQITFI